VLAERVTEARQRAQVEDLVLARDGVRPRVEAGRGGAREAVAARRRARERLAERRDDKLLRLVVEAPRELRVSLRVLGVVAIAPRRLGERAQVRVEE